MDAELRVLVIADHLLTRTGLTALLAAQTDLQLVGQVAGSDTLSDDLEVYRPNAAIYDLGYDPLNAIPHLAQLAPLPVVALLPDAEYGSAAVAALGESSAYALLLRDSSPESIATALNATVQGLIAIDPVLARALISADASALEVQGETLTPREIEVLQLVAEGLPNKIIAQRLKISPNTVKFHINAILGKLNAQSRTEAVVRATRLGWVIL
ncbi:MAG: response regulator transcription factor [Anaerolineae bacterium]|jgi:DNA-binding NarL/FixJ family response regulator|nr:response regulator transcription factor [Anaerolineae bacterium]